MKLMEEGYFEVCGCDAPFKHVYFYPFIQPELRNQKCPYPLFSIEAGEVFTDVLVSADMISEEKKAELLKFLKETVNLPENATIPDEIILIAALKTPGSEIDDFLELSRN